MAVFRYQATELASGASKRGELVADSPQQVRVALRRMGLLPARVHELGSEDRKAGQVGHPARRALHLLAERVGRHRRQSRLVEFYESLSALLAAGVPITGALDTLARSGNASARRRDPLGTVCRRLSDGVRRGEGLAAAMEHEPGWFGSIDVALVRASEESGTTERTLLEIAAHHGRSEELRTRLMVALAYPALLVVFGLGVVAFLTTTTLPQLAGVLQDASVEVPGATAVLLAIGNTITGQPLMLATSVLGLIAVLIWFARTPRLARARLRTPLLGRILLRSQIASLAFLLSRLLRCGLPLTEALELVCPSIGNARLRGTFEGLPDELRSGRSVASSLGAVGLFEPVFCRVLEVGEESGELSGSLEIIGARYRESARRLIDRLAATLEPVVILLLAAAVGFVVYGAIAPMLRLTQTL